MITILSNFYQSPDPELQRKTWNITLRSSAYRCFQDWLPMLKPLNSAASSKCHSGRVKNRDGCWWWMGMTKNWANCMLSHPNYPVLGALQMPFNAIARTWLRPRTMLRFPDQAVLYWCFRLKDRTGDLAILKLMVDTDHWSSIVVGDSWWLPTMTSRRGYTNNNMQPLQSIWDVSWCDPAGLEILLHWQENSL